MKAPEISQEQVMKVLDQCYDIAVKGLAKSKNCTELANEYLDTALLLIDEKYDGLDNYIKNVLKIDDELIQSLRELYLEPKKASK